MIHVHYLTLLLVCMVVCVVFLLYNDHQFYWCEQMWETEAVVMAMEMLQRDGHGRVWAHYGALSWRSYCLDLPFCTRTSFVVFHVVLGLGSVVPLSFVMDMVGYCVRHTPSFRTLWIFYICGVYLNWFYLFYWDVTIIFS